MLTIEVMSREIASAWLAKYLTAKHGKVLSVYENGFTDIETPSVELRMVRQRLHGLAVATVACPGKEKFEMVAFLEDYASFDKTVGLYVDSSGKVIGDLCAVITWRCSEGDITEEADQLAQAIRNCLAATVVKLEKLSVSLEREARAAARKRRR